MTMVKNSKNPEHISTIVARAMKKIKDNTRAIVRCDICDKIELVKPNSREHKAKLCVDCCSAYYFILKHKSDHDI